MFFKKNVAADDAVHHTRMSERAIIFNVVACAAWWAAISNVSPIAFIFIPILLIAVLYVHLSGVAYSVILARKCRMYGRAASVFLVSAAPLLAIGVAIIRGETR
jgi:hypothetical protein